MIPQSKQYQWLTEEIFETQLNYWKQQLIDAPALLALPTDRSRPPVQTFLICNQHFNLNSELTHKIKLLSQQSETTFFMVLLSAFATLLSRYSNQEDILIGSPVVNRNCQEIESVFFVNTLVLRTDLSGSPTFLELLYRVRQMTLDACAHQDLPFEKLEEELQSERHLSHNALFQVMFVLENTPLCPSELSESISTSIGLENEAAKFDLLLSMEQSNGGLKGYFRYNNELFNQDTISRWLGHFQTLLEGIVTNPKQEVFQLPLLTEAERHQILVKWNSTEKECSQDKCIHQLFENAVKLNEDAVAAVFEDTQLTYRELNTRANQLAHHLQTIGVGPEILVGLFVERSLEMLIGLLGILKAGGAYLPIDLAYPKKRIAFMLEDANVSILITQEKLLAELPASDTKALCLDRDWPAISRKNTENPVSKVKPNNLVYVIYTSGSTGAPKGVLVTHYTLTRLFSVTQPWFNFSKQDVWALFHSIAFDFSVWELWGALLFGGRLVVIPYGVSRSPQELYELLYSEQVTILNQNPSAFQQLIQLEESSKNIKKLSLRLVVFGAEKLELQSLKPWFKRHGDQYPQLVNMYGITESTVHVTYHLLTMADIESNIVKIGSPKPELLQIFILNKQLQLAPIGVPGELYVGGIGLAQGYLNRPELTAEKFISNPFNDKQDYKIHKTGDLARYLPDGNIEFIGRTDYQVKIRGFRIELGEIENALITYGNKTESTLIHVEHNNNDDVVVRCAKCLLPATYTAIHFDDEGVCNICRKYKKYEKLTHSYFKNINDFKCLVENIKQSDNKKYDCMLLYSGGKDSSYVLYQLVDMGLKVLTFTFDNGYISPMTFENIKRMTSNLKVDNIIYKNENMPKIFRESLIFDHTVCTGCFKVLTTVSAQIAYEKGH